MRRVAGVTAAVGQANGGGGGVGKLGIGRISQAPDVVQGFSVIRTSVAGFLGSFETSLSSHPAPPKP